MPTKRGPSTTPPPSSRKKVKPSTSTEKDPTSTQPKAPPFSPDEDALLLSLHNGVRDWDTIWREFTLARGRSKKQLQKRFEKLRNKGK
ncbi:hypothetical protein HK104_007501, partial [Borealophlyctis nickersoniae]